MGGCSRHSPEPSPVGKEGVTDSSALRDQRPRPAHTATPRPQLGQV